MRNLYVTEERTEREMAKLLGISRARVADAIQRAGIERRTTKRACPVSAKGLKQAFAASGATVASVARRFNVSDATAARWLADAGLLSPDPRIDQKRLETLYVDEALTVREVAERLGITPERVRRELAIAGLPARSNRVRRPRANRAKVTTTRLVDLYVKQRHNLHETATILGVSTEYVRKALDEAGLFKRLGSFTPRALWEPDELRQRCAELYEEGLSMKAVGEEMGVSVGTVRVALHQAGVPVRRGGFASQLNEGATLLDDLYGDPKVLKILARYHVVIPEEWAPTGPFASLAPFPLASGLVTALYERVGLPIFHMSLLLGVGQGAVRGALKAAGVALRASSEPAPWTSRRASATGPQS